MHMGFKKDMTVDSLKYIPGLEFEVEWIDLIGSLFALYRLSLLRMKGPFQFS